MIKQLLEAHYDIRRFSNCYLISTDNADKTLVELNQFIGSKFFKEEQHHIILEDSELIDDELKSDEPKSSLVEKHPDYICVRKTDSKIRNISVEQIRSMQSFLYKTSVISGRKIAVIYAADQMNLNAANSCLKILEDTPKNAYIFLITSNAADILPTIRSRCAKINIRYVVDSDFETDIKFLKPLDKKTPIEEKLKFIAEFALKDRDLWTEFSTAMENLIVKFCKKISGVNIYLSEEELSVLHQLKFSSPGYLQIKYDKIKEVIDSTNIFDLELRSSCIMLIDKFRS